MESNGFKHGNTATDEKAAVQEVKNLERSERQPEKGNPSTSEPRRYRFEPVAVMGGKGNCVMVMKDHDQKTTFTGAAAAVLVVGAVCFVAYSAGKLIAVAEQAASNKIRASLRKRKLAKEQVIK